MIKIKEIKDLFSFEMTDESFAEVESHANRLTALYVKMSTYTETDVKETYKLSNEDYDFIKYAVRELPVIQALGINLSEDMVAKLKSKVLFTDQANSLLPGLKKLVAKLERAESIAASESYGLATVIEDALGNAVSQKKEGAGEIYNNFRAEKKRTVRAIESRNKMMKLKMNGFKTVKTDVPLS